MIQLVLCTVLIGIVSAQSNICGQITRPGRIYMNPNDCRYYTQCDGFGNEHQIFPCKTPGHVFDPFRKNCVPESESINCTIDYDLYDQLCLNVEQGDVAMPNSCARYVACWQGVFVYPPMECAHGTLFDPSTGKCEHSNLVECGFRPISNNFDGKACIYKAFPGDCTQYKDCTNVNDVRKCGEGTFMSNSKHTCVYCHSLTSREKIECNVNC